MPTLLGDDEISSSLRVMISLFIGKSNGQWLIGCNFYGLVLGVAGGSLGVRGLWVSMFDGFWVPFGVVVLTGGFF